MLHVSGYFQLARYFGSWLAILAVGSLFSLLSHGSDFEEIPRDVDGVGKAQTLDLDLFRESI